MYQIITKSTGSPKQVTSGPSFTQSTMEQDQERPENLQNSEGGIDLIVETIEMQEYIPL